MLKCDAYDGPAICGWKDEVSVKSNNQRQRRITVGDNPRYNGNKFRFIVWKDDEAIFVSNQAMNYDDAVNKANAHCMVIAPELFNDLEHITIEIVEIRKSSKIQFGIQ